MAPPIIGCRYFARPKYFSDDSQTARLTREVLIIAADEGMVLVEELTDGPRQKSGRRGPRWKKGDRVYLETLRWAFDFVPT